jgi:hypothetical protein
MSIYDAMIINNIKGFFSWLNTEKNMKEISTTSWRLIDELAKEYIEETYGDKT